MEILVTIIHVLVCLLLVVAVLLQSGKGGGLAASLGGGLASSSVLGGRSAANFLTKATTILATVFMLSCLVQSIAFQKTETAPTTATERVLDEGGLPLQPSPIGQTESPLIDGSAGEGAAEGSAEGSAEGAAGGAQEQAE